MGLQVTTNFDTPQGFTVSSVYLRVVSVMLSKLGTPTPTALVFFEAFVSRDKAVTSASPIMVPAMPTTVSFQASIADCIRHEVMYAYVKRELSSRGFVCETALEAGQSAVEYTIPEETVVEPAPAPAPEETVVEPAPAPEETAPPS